MRRRAWKTRGKRWSAFNKEMPIYDQMSGWRVKAERQPCQNLGFFGPVGSAKALMRLRLSKNFLRPTYDLSFCHRSQLPSRQVEGPDQRPFFRHFSPNPTAFRRKALSEQMLAMISASASDNRSSERLSLIDRRTLESSAMGNYRPLAASPSPSCSRRLSGSARSVVLFTKG